MTRVLRKSHNKFAQIKCEKQPICAHLRLQIFQGGLVRYLHLPDARQFHRIAHTPARRDTVGLARSPSRLPLFLSVAVASVTHTCRVGARIQAEPHRQLQKTLASQRHRGKKA